MRLCLEIDAHRVTLTNVMSIEHPRFKSTVAAIAVIVTLCLPVNAQNADLTDETVLLEQLAVADEVTARRLERQLQAIWRKTGSASMDLLLKRGRDALEVDDIVAAIEHLTALTDHAPDFAEGYSLRARAYFAADLLGPAMLDLETALALNPNNYNAILGLAAILETFGDQKRAFEAYTRVQAIHPHHEAATEALERLRPRVMGKTL